MCILPRRVLRDGGVQEPKSDTSEGRACERANHRAPSRSPDSDIYWGISLHDDKKIESSGNAVNIRTLAQLWIHTITHSYIQKSKTTLMGMRIHLRALPRSAIPAPHFFFFGTKFVLQSGP